MTREQIEQAAKKYNEWYINEYHQLYKEGRLTLNSCDTWNCYIAGAESRQAEIDELVYALSEARSFFAASDEQNYQYVLFDNLLKKYENGA